MVRNPDLEIDARGLLCPLPVLRLRKRIEAMAPGAEILLLATDPAAVIDVPHFCNQSGHAYLGAEALDDGSTAHRVRKGG